MFVLCIGMSQINMDDDSRILLNRCKSKILEKNPDIKKLTDVMVFKIIARRYVGDSNE